MASSFLTIGVPTYGRADAALRCVGELLALDLADGVRVLVIDNASPDGTAELLSATFDDPRLTVLRNPENVGYAGNVLRLIAEADSDYLLFLSDEDTVLPDGLAELISFCRAHGPRLVSPRAEVGGNSLYRGRAATGPIEAEDFERASFYVSGLTVAISSILEDAKTVGRLVDSNAAARLYPQVILTALATTRGDAYFLDSVVTSQVQALDSHIAAAGGANYRTLPSRWEQFVGYEAFFSSEIDAAGDSRAGQSLRRMRETQRRGLGALLRAAAVLEVPVIGNYLERPLSVLLTEAVKRQFDRLRPSR